jgi:hypothetical protein
MSMAEDTRKRPDFSSDYSSTPARDSASDPLAELARLIGQSDPFTDGAKRSQKSLDGVKGGDRPAPEWLARPASSPDHDYAEEPHAPAYVPPASYRAEDYEAASSQQAAAAQDYRAVPTGFADDGGHAESNRYAADHAEHDPHAHRTEHDGAADQATDDAYQADDRYRVALPSGQYEGDGYYADDGHMPPQGEEGRASVGRRGGIMTIAAVLGLAVIGTAGAFGYRAFTSGSGTSSNPPVIKADPTPAKTVPAPAAAASADQSKPFQDRIGAMAAPERVVPREEQPVSLPVAPPAQRVTAPQPSAQAMAPLVSPPPTSVNEPKRVKTIAIRQDGGNIDTGTISAPPPGTAPAASAKAPASKQQSGSGPMAIAPQSDPAARTKVATRTPAPVAGGAYVVQVSAQRSENEAQSAYQTLQAKYPGVLGGRNANIKRVDLGDKGGVFYRAQVGSFATSEQATTFCNSLKDAGGQCIVQKN